MFYEIPKKKRNKTTFKNAVHILCGICWYELVWEFKVLLRSDVFLLLKKYVFDQVVIYIYIYIKKKEDSKKYCGTSQYILSTEFNLFRMIIISF